jgi:cell division protein FtsB
MSAPRRKKVLIATAAVAVALAALSALDPNGYRKHLRLHAEVQRYGAENARLAGENARLAREVAMLRSDPAAIERAVREELRYVRAGEIVIRTDGNGGRER